MLTKVISGGQTGADEAALRAAKFAGLETGGWMPRGFVTLDGFRPEFRTLYGMEEHESALYPPRTMKNVEDSDGTIRFASDFGSRGELLTMRCIRKHNKPYLDVDVKAPLSVASVKAWLTDNKIQTLNAAGNSERTSPGIGEFVEAFLRDVFAE